MHNDRYHITLLVKIDADSAMAAADRGWEIASQVQADNDDVPVTAVVRVD